MESGTREKEKQKNGRAKEDEVAQRGLGDGLGREGEGKTYVRRARRTVEDRGSSWVYTLQWSRYAGVRSSVGTDRMAGVVRDCAPCIGRRTSRG